jgi:hypothetical protein
MFSKGESVTIYFKLQFIRVEPRHRNFLNFPVKVSQ